jgi:hypothetical protein
MKKSILLTVLVLFSFAFTSALAGLLPLKTPDQMP